MFENVPEMYPLQISKYATELRLYVELI